MKLFKTEFFIANKLAGAGESRAVMQRVASLSVAVSVCVMIVAVSVIYGFKQEILSRLEILGANMKIVAVDSRGAIETTPINREENLEKTIAQVVGVENITPYAVKGGVFKNSGAIQGVILKGVDSVFNFTPLVELLVEGEIPRVNSESRTKDLLISQSMAKNLAVGLDSRVELVFIDDDNEPRVDKYVVKGIYSSEFEQVDDFLCVTDLRNVQKLNQWQENQISGYEIKAVDGQNLDEFSDKVFYAMLAAGSSQALLCMDMRDSYPMIFDWLKAHDINGIVIIVIMLIVAIFNMISALLIILLERTTMIGVLKTLGLSSAALQRIFVLKSSKIVLWGMFWGNLVGVSLCLVQKYFKLIKLDEQGYFLTSVPIAFNFTPLLLLNLAAFVFICLVMMIPTRIITNIKPDITLRYK